jgi:hypothetical protein
MDRSPAAPAVHLLEKNEEIDSPGLAMASKDHVV